VDKAEIGIKKMGRLYDGRRDRPVAWWQTEIFPAANPSAAIVKFHTFRDSWRKNPQTFTPRK
jgi:hypothetical protein